ncbi:hypothetical protein LCGC14_2097690 [marine sediment metagenome]|uniref:Uncharacterized protein n=1 Tax=marine sediment metagenome TaxID=412755 RepID=A0A0F9EB16_9ZZZZ
MELKLQPDLTLQMLKSWHDPRTVPWLDLFGRAFGKIWRGSRSSVIAKFCEWGVYFMRHRRMPPDAYMTQEAVEVLVRDREGPEFPATSPEQVVGSGLADAAGTRQPRAVSANRLDPLQVILAATFTAFQRRPELERV